MKRFATRVFLLGCCLLGPLAEAAKDPQMGAFEISEAEFANVQKLNEEARLVELKGLGSCLIGVGSAEIEGKDAAAVAEAQRRAEANAKGRMGEFIHGLTTETAAEQKTMESIVSMVTDGKTKETAKVEETYTSTVKTQSKGVLRATRLLAAWTSDDGSVRTVAVVFSKKFLEDKGPAGNLMREANSLSKKAVSGQKAIRSVGTAAVLKGDTATARQQAISYARENAVREGLGSLVESETVADEMSTKIRLREKAHGFVIEDVVVAEAQEGQFYRVVLDAIVSTELLNKDLRGFRALQESIGMPRVTVKLSEKWQDGKAGGDAAASKLTELLQQNGYSLLAPGATDAEVEFQGTCTLSSAGKDKMDRVLVNATTDYRAVMVSTGQLLASAQDTQRVAMANPDEAASMAAKRASNQTFKKMHAQIADQWSNMARSGSNFVVVLEKVKSYAAEGRAFQKMLEGLSGVASVQKTSFAESVLVLGVQYRGKSSDLEEAIFGALEQKSSASLQSVDFKESQGNRLVFYCK